MPSPSRPVLRELHSTMVRIRVFEDEAGALVEQARIPGLLHLYVGEEAVAAGVIAHLDREDQITSTHRGHGHLIAKGAPMGGMFAELYGRRDGLCKGKGGSIHISDLSLGSLGANGIVGGGLPIAVGAAFAHKYRANGRVVVSFFGDGATNIGSFHEALNMAAVLDLPVVFVCENNLYGEYTAQGGHQAIKDIADRGASYGIPGVAADGMDAVAMYEIAGEAIGRARSGGGPSLIEAKTYRFYDHQGVTGLRIKYRPEDEVAQWRERDPIPAIEHTLRTSRIMTRRAIAEVWDAAREEVAEAIRFAEASPEPGPEHLLEDVYTTTGAS